MNIKTLEQLDYYRIRDSIAKHCMSLEGAKSLKRRVPFSDKSIIAQHKKEVGQWMKYLDSGKPTALEGWEEVEPLFSILSVEGATLEQEEIYALGTFCKAVSTIKTRFSEDESSFFCAIKERVCAIADLSHAEKTIFRIITKDGELKELAELKAIQSSIQGLRRSIDVLLKKYTGDNALSDALQSHIPALRSNRQVLAVKANFRGRIKGIVHEMSQTGQTLYIEPDDIVQKNNELIQEEFKLSQEIRRILKELTAQLAEYKEDFISAQKEMIHLDCDYAAARFGIHNNCIIAEDCTEEDENGLQLLKARHPLLGSKAVPITVKFQKKHRLLIITGPNTGGKTVTLKTIALFSLLNQSGFPLPAAEQTRLPFFKNIFADIGDEQSLDQSLSTFSGHMKNIALMLSDANKDSLVLLDELGSGTDPQEGGAIAMAVLDELIKRESFVLVTTHHGILKNYGYTHESCINASVDFDESTLSPTYRILMGVPGESHALDIARRSGIDKVLVEKAEKYIVNGETDVSKLIKGLNKKHEELAEIEKKCRQQEHAVQEKIRATDLKELRLRQKEMELREQGYSRSSAFLDENRKMLENLVRELREGEITREKTLKVKHAIAKMSESVNAEKKAMIQDEEALQTFREAIEEQSLKIPKKKTPKKRKITFADLDDASLEMVEKAKIPVALENGLAVLIGKNRREGTIIETRGKNNFVVQIGSLKMSVKKKDIIPNYKLIGKKDSPKSNNYELDTSSKNEDASRVSFGDAMESLQDKPKFELRLLGMHYEEAMKALERQLDLCAIYNFRNFSIIHGKGHGILQKAVQDYLHNYPGVEDFHFARPEEGGTGKTYVTLG